MAFNFGKMATDATTNADVPNENDTMLREMNSKPVNPFQQKDATFAALFEDDEESEALLKAKTNDETGLNRYNSQTIEKILEDNIKELRIKYPMGGLKASRFLTTEVLLNTPASYFDQFEETITKGVSWVQNLIADGGKASIIGDAQLEPTNDEKQEDAYRIVNSAAADYLDKKSSLRNVERKLVITMICNEIIGFGRIDPLWRDKNVNEILCNGPKDVQVEIGGLLRRVPGCVFRDRDHLMVLIERLYGAIGKIVSRTTPIVDGRLHDKSRMAVVHHSVAPEGPNFSIRRHKDDYIGPDKLVGWNSATPELLTFLGNLIYKGCSILVIGGTSSGKTTLMAGLSGFMRPDHRILVLEDNIELKPAPNKLTAASMECLPARADSPGSGVTMRDLVKASLRMAPQAIIVGEVRDGAAMDLIQALNTGHYGMSTIHANSEYDAIYRMSSLISSGGEITGDATLPLIAAGFDVIVRIDRFPTDGSRKIVSISEVGAFPQRRESGDMYLPTKVLWEFVDEGLDENMKVLGHWEQLSEISEERRKFRRLDLEKDLTWEELVEIVYN